MKRIKDVAKEAGVSVATVSRVLNGSDAVKVETQRKVKEAVRRIGYSPNLLGRNLRQNKTGIILVMLSTLTNNFCSKVIHGIELAAKKQGYNIMICATGDSKESEQTYLSFVRNKMADGIIILNSNLTAQEMQMASASFPVVQCSEYVDTERTPYVSIDNRKAAYDATINLINSGRKKIVFMGVENNLVSSNLRFLGYRDALDEANIPFDENLIVYGNYGYRNAMRVTEKLIQNNVSFDALFAISDRMAAGAMTALKKHDIKIPDDVCVMGFDNTDITYLFEPSISTVSQPQIEMGETAFQLLLARIEEETAENIILQHKIILRDSTKNI
ncbi:MAG: LacI family DNA-binding transcriptional regulator [Clostridia bacterium]|nr:LacI family DNA-binding transcriptional regulator [Clostridia bacterium]